MSAYPTTPESLLPLVLAAMSGTPNALQALALAAFVPASRAQGSDWPRGGAVRLIGPFTADGGSDVLARSVGEKPGAALGSAVVIENKPGAGGTLGAALVAKAPAGGYTLQVQGSGHGVNPALYPRLPYDTLKDLEGVSPLA